MSYGYGSNEVVQRALERERRRIDALERQLQEAEARQARQDAEIRSLLLTSDQYIRYERIPQFVGGVTHSAGSEEIGMTRAKYEDPNYGTPGSGYNFKDATTAGSATVLDVSNEEGKLLTVGFLASGSNSGAWSGGETIDAVFRITIDGGTPTDLPLSSGGAAGWDAWALPWASAVNGSISAPPKWGSVDGDAFHLDLAFEYQRSLKLEIVVNSTSGFTAGETLLWFCYTHRARYVSE